MGGIIIKFVSTENSIATARCTRYHVARGDNPMTEERAGTFWSDAAQQKLVEYAYLHKDGDLFATVGMT